jgi:hypothetical protein
MLNIIHIIDKKNINLLILHAISSNFICPRMFDEITTCMVEPAKDEVINLTLQ